MRPTLIRLGAIVRKEFLHLGRDPRMLLAVVIMPVVQLLLFAYAISFDVEDVPTIVIDLDQTQSSRTYLENYEGSPFFDVNQHGTRIDEVDQAFDTNAAQVAVVIPAGFARTLASGEAAQVQVLVDGSQPTQARLSQAYSVAINQLYGQELTLEWADTQGLDLNGLGMMQPRVRTWYNPNRSSSDFLIPGLMVVILAIVTVQQTAVTLVRERDQGTQEQLEVSPMRRMELMVGKLLPWTVIAFADMLMITGLGQLIFHVPMRGSFVALCVASALFVFASLGMGLAISAIAPSLDSANILAMLIAFLPSFLLSGFAFDLQQIPVPLQVISLMFPARYMVTVSRAVFLKGADFPEIWPQLLALGVYAVVMLTISSILYGRRSAR